MNSITNTTDDRLKQMERLIERATLATNVGQS